MRMRGTLALVCLLLLAACGRAETQVSLEGAGETPTAASKVAAGSGIENDGRPPMQASEQAYPATPLPAAPETSEAPATPTPRPGPRELGQDEDAQIGQPYFYRLYTHCGISTTWWNGAWWNASPVQDDGNGNPPPQWGNPYQDGVMVQVSEQRLQFTGEQGQRADFVPRPATEGTPPPCA